MNYLFISGILFVLSIVAFLIRNGINQLTLREIFGNEGYNRSKPWSLTNYPGAILMFGVVYFIMCSPLTPLVTICAGILIIIIQRLIIWAVLQLLNKVRN
jgi:hypothetical protein